MNTSGEDSTISLKRVPAELHGGIRMVCARQRISIRDWLCLTLYSAVDRELNDWPEWRYQTKRGEEHKLFADGRKAAGLKRRRKKREPDEAPIL